MWTHRRFTWRYRAADPAALDQFVDQATAVLARLCEQLPQFYRDPADPSGMAFGILEFSVTISDRDRWWVARRARFLVDELRRDSDLPLGLMSEESRKLPVHMSRGKWRLRRLARARENHG